MCRFSVTFSDFLWFSAIFGDFRRFQSASKTVTSSETLLRSLGSEVFFPSDSPSRGRWCLGFPSLKSSSLSSERSDTEHALSSKKRSKSIFNRHTLSLPDLDKETDGQPKCPPTFDGYLCWYDIEASTKLTLQCPQLFENAGNKAKRECLAGGQWSGRVDYSQCGSNRFSVNIFVVNFCLF